MAYNKKQIRLCSNCKSGSTCTFPKDPDTPSYYCEEYELDELPPRVMLQTPRKGHAVTEKKKIHDFKGLCMDCENCPTCKFSKPEGGVWHCEEYQ